MSVVEKSAGTRWATCEEVADFLRISPGTVRNWTASGVIPCYRFRRVVRFDLDEVDSWARGEAVETTSTERVEEALVAARRQHNPRRIMQ